jgi:phosphoglycerate kinase
MSKFLSIDDFDLDGKVVIVRVDVNSSIDTDTNKILDDTRIRIHAGTVRVLSEKNARVVVLAHQGRPGSADFTTLKEHAIVLGKHVGQTVKYVDDIYGAKAKSAIKLLKPGEILVLENVRMFSGERDKKSPEEHAESDLVRNLAPLADIFINDAFAAAHRSQASLVGFTVLLPSGAGSVMERELVALNRVKDAKEKPCIYVLGGAKADDAAAISDYVLDKGTADYVLTGGVIGHLFLHAKGLDIGEPNVKYLEKEKLLEFVPKIEELLKKYEGKILMPLDVAISVRGEREELNLDDLPTDQPIFDIGPKTIKEYTKILLEAKIIVLSGPMGVYEQDNFLPGTKGVFEAAAKSKAFSVAGGGHTIAALGQLGLTTQISYISTGGGALMEFLMGKTLPAVAALENAAKRT